ncbi:hypothetical protein MW887_007162 [Aspergillus wentii]|nr:hypothetical protein MW887_007162 [Aspergillus wentii]
MSPCCICLASFDEEFEALLTFTELPEWNNRTRTALCSDHKFNKIYFKTPWMWGTFVRFLIDNSTRDNGQPGQRYQLSGVGQLGCWQRDYRVSVPRDEDVVIVGRPPPRQREEAVSIGPMPITSHDSSHFGTHQFHDRCWQVVSRVFSSIIVEQSLDLFVRSILQRCQSYECERLFRTPPRSERKEYIAEYCRIRRNTIREDFHQGPLKYVQHRVDRFHASIAREKKIIPHDPLNILELRDLIEEATRLRVRPEAETSQRGIVYRLPYLPLGVQMVIVDLLHRVLDMRHLLLAFDWRLPDAYWRSRLPKHVVFEYEDLQHAHLDWEYLCLGVLDMMKTSHALRHRERTLSNLKAIRTIFNGLLEVKEED